MKATLEIQNLKCGGCAKTITEKITHIADVSKIEVEVDKSLVHVTFEKQETIPLVEKSLASIGYPIVGDKNSMITKAKSFVSCATGKLSQ